MKRAFVALAVLAAGGCHRIPSSVPAASAFGVAIVDIGGEQQVAGVGATLDQPVVAQVNDAQGNGVAGALVEFRALGGARFDPPSGLTGSDGQFSTTVRLGSISGRYSLVATTRDKAGKPLQVKFAEIALDYQQTLGRELNEKYCSRCHSSESTAERVSNHDNLSVPPHGFSDGATLNQISRANLIAIIAHGGAALGKSPEMPPYSPTLSASDIDALAAYTRAVADPPYRPQGVFYANP
ncbi:MAG TPA: c-type cytochrome [Bryobacteraceae bacterium]|jgi:mono/diheme cytochrome c family protein